MVEITSINDRIIFLITNLGISKKTFANTIEHSPGNVTDWTKSRKKPSKKAIRKICEVFNVSQLWLENGEGNIYLDIKSENDEMQQFKEDLLNSDFAKKYIRLTEEEKKTLDILADGYIKEKEERNKK